MLKVSTVNGHFTLYVVVCRARDAWRICRLVSTSSRIFSGGCRCCHKLAPTPAHCTVLTPHWLNYALCIVICIFHCFRVCDVAWLNCVQITYFVCDLMFVFFVRQTYKVYALGFVHVFHGPFIVCHYIFYKDCIVQYLLYYLVIYMLIFLVEYQSKCLVSRNVNSEHAEWYCRYHMVVIFWTECST